MGITGKQLLDDLAAYTEQTWPVGSAANLWEFVTAKALWTGLSAG
jgi:hypothetical protein